jgi:hypothetical protein
VRWTADRGRGGASPTRGVRALELAGDGGVAMRRRTGGSERRWLELIVRAKEGAKELGREGMRCGEGQGSQRHFIGARGASERGGRGGVMVALMALTPLKTGVRLRGGLRGGGNDGGSSSSSGGIRGWS